jgi:hypothetical protein
MKLDGKGIEGVRAKIAAEFERVRLTEIEQPKQSTEGESFYLNMCIAPAPVELLQDSAAPLIEQSLAVAKRAPPKKAKSSFTVDADANIPFAEQAKKLIDEAMRGPQIRQERKRK